MYPAKESVRILSTLGASLPDLLFPVCICALWALLVIAYYVFILRRQMLSSYLLHFEKVMP